MGEESVKGANMGVILLIFAAILALGLIIFMLARNMANEGLTNVSERLEAASNSEFSDFDQKIIVGQRVNAALSGFKGKKVAVLIATQGLTDKVVAGFTQNTAIDTGLMSKDGKATGNAGVLKDTAVITGHESMVFAFAARPGTLGDTESANRKAIPASSSGKTNDKQLVFVQYNAVLEATDNFGVAGGTGKNTVIWWNADHYVMSGGFRADAGGKTVFDTIFANTSKSGTTEYVPSAARFNANLLKDENGVILGIVLQQVGS